MIFGKKYTGTIAYLGGVMALPEPFVWSWTQMIIYNSDFLVQPGEEICYNRANNSYHAFARNTLVKQMRGDWLLMLDTDHQFDPDIAARLLFVMNNSPVKVQVLSAIYQYKNPPYSPKIYQWDKRGKTFEAIGGWTFPKVNKKGAGLGLVPIGAGGAGCLLVKREVFDLITKKLKQDPFDITHPYSEDVSFYLRLKKIGIKAYCVPEIEYHHLEYRPLSLSDYQKDTVSLKKYKV